MNLAGIVTLIFLMAGCGTTVQSGRTVRPMSEDESPKDVESAMGAVVGSVTGQPVGSKDLRNLGQQVRTDKEAQSAIESITGVVNDPAAMGKYCPVDGERYSGKFEVCPKHNVPLKYIEE